MNFFNLNLSKKKQVDWKAFFLANTAHEWIVNDKYILSNMMDFLEDLPEDLLKKMCTTHSCIFVPISAQYSCSVTQSQESVILIFPELMSLLKSTAKSYYKAILAHELGHILGDHAKKSLSGVESQVDADHFAIKLGFGEDLEKFLLERSESIEKRVRLSYLSSRYFQNL